MQFRKIFFYFHILRIFVALKHTLLASLDTY